MDRGKETSEAKPAGKAPLRFPLDGPPAKPVTFLFPRARAFVAASAGVVYRAENGRLTLQPAQWRLINAIHARYVERGRAWLEGDPAAHLAPDELDLETATRDELYRFVSGRDPSCPSQAPTAWLKREADRMMNTLDA
ncbi:MAG: hypothetical protein C4523_19745 [Myxococcales bacterium]|nr:MAG: hypothetical protein C4523_19745 [Myxococcales bacterium]